MVPPLVLNDPPRIGTDGETGSFDLSRGSGVASRRAVVFHFAPRWSEKGVSAHHQIGPRLPQVLSNLGHSRQQTIADIPSVTALTRVVCVCEIPPPCLRSI